MYSSVYTPTVTHKHTFKRQRDRLRERKRERERVSRTNSEAVPEPSRGQFLKHSLCDWGGPEIWPLAHKLSGDARMLSGAAVEGRR